MEKPFSDHMSWRNQGCPVDHMIHLFTSHESPFLSGLSLPICKLRWLEGISQAPLDFSTIGQQTAGPFGQGWQ